MSLDDAGRTIGVARAQHVENLDVFINRMASVSDVGQLAEDSFDVRTVTYPLTEIVTAQQEFLKKDHNGKFVLLPSSVRSA